MPRTIVLGCLILGLLLPATTRAQDYTSEITTHVIDPCVLAAVRHNDLDEMMDEREAVAIMKLLMGSNINEIVDIVENLVRGKDRATRMQLYPALRGLCIENMLSAGS